MVKRYFYTIIIAFFSVITCQAQFYNTEVEATLDVTNNNEFINIVGTAFNKTEISQSLRYVLSVIRTDSKTDSLSKSEEEGRFVLDPIQKKALPPITINSNETDRIIVLLLVYDLEDNIKGKARVVFNDDEDVDSAKKLSSEISSMIEPTNASPDIDNRHKDGIVLRGIVVEETKTKPGRDFYSMFYTAYSLNNINSDKIVVVKEVLAMGTNTKIEVKVGDITIFEFLTRPSNEFLKEMTDISIRRIFYYLQQLERQKNIINHY